MAEITEENYEKLEENLLFQDIKKTSKIIETEISTVDVVIIYQNDVDLNEKDLFILGKIAEKDENNVVAITIDYIGVVFHVRDKQHVVVEIKNLEILMKVIENNKAN